jgi:hypothetical protein
MTMTARLIAIEARQRARRDSPQRDADIDPTGALSALNDDDLAAFIEHRPLSPAAAQALAAWERDQARRHGSQFEEASR